MKGFNIKLVLAGVLAALSLAAATAFVPTPSTAQSCCRYVIRGCDRTAQICVGDSCGSSAEQRARRAFESAYSCRSSSTSSYIGTCSNERCDIDLR